MNLLEKLSYISKSKKNLYDKCPLAFKLSYIDKVEQDIPAAWKRGTVAHNFYDDYFDHVKITEGKLLIDENFEIDGDYNINFAKFQQTRFDNIVSKIDDIEKFFFPIMKERMIKTQVPKLIGVPDAVFRCLDGKPIVVEYKTGRPTADKLGWYMEDLLFYKILLKAENAEMDISRGSMYFGYSNFVHNVALCEKETQKLSHEIDVVREKILNEVFPATPSRDACKWCTVRASCSVKVE